MNDKKICFIACTNNELLMSECTEYINRLYIPEGYEIDLLAVSDAKSMTSGYNEAMKATDAKYKVYLHQDVFITNRYFIQDILDIFNSDENIGLIGMVGYPKVSLNGVMWYERRVGAVPMYGAAEAFKDVEFENYRYDIADGFTDVAVADGLMLVTSQDIEWDETFDAWDFYDATQSLRFRNAGYRAVVPVQKVPWFVHDDGYYLSVFNYNKYRHQFLEKYKEIIDNVNSIKERALDPKKIAFICCVNNEQYYEECLWYVSHLELPEYEVSFLPIRGARSMAEGYNLAMEQSDAKYKFYIHQDVFVTDASIILKCIDEFEKNENMGLLGIIGTDNEKKDAFFWNCWNLGATLVVTGDMHPASTDNCDEMLYKAIAIDGMFMATQYDLRWRTDIGLKWDYYDISQSYEFTRNGYELGVVGMRSPVVIHECGVTKIGNIDYSRRLFINAYKDLGFDYREEYKYEMIGKKSTQIENDILAFFKQRKYIEIVNLVDKVDYNSSYIYTTNVRLVAIFLNIYNEEIQNGTSHTYIGNMMDFEEMKTDFYQLTFLLRRCQFDSTNGSLYELKKWLSDNYHSDEAIKHACMRASVTYGDLYSSIFETTINNN